MKYGLSKESPPDEKDESENKTESSPSEVVAVVKANENESESSNVDHTLHINAAPKAEEIRQLSINETVETNRILLSPSLEKHDSCEIQTNARGPIPIDTSKPLLMRENHISQLCDESKVLTAFEVAAMICDVTPNDAITLEEAVMDIVTSIDEEHSEVEMVSKPTTPNDIDMSDNCTLETVAQSSLNHNFKNVPIVELSRYSWGTNEQKYLRGCLFSPDGTCILSTVNKDGMHIVELPLSLYDNEGVSADRPLDILTSAVHVPEGGTVYDYCWYPFMNSTLPETCCFMSTRQHEPIQLWDAFDGKLRCTYRGYDAVDEVESALSVCFSVDGSQVIAGYKKTLKIFRTDAPGRDYTNFAIKSPAACLAINRSDANMIAIGSWNSFVTFHDVRSPKLTVTEKLVKHTGGVTLMKFSADGNRLITGARKDNKLLGWDVRNVNEPLFSLHRNVETNQKIYFDLSWSDQWLVSGDTNGILHAYDVKYGTENGKFPDYQYPLHRDCCNGVSLHPTRPIFATASGEHHFIGIEEDIALKSAKVQENSLIFWWCGNSD